MEGMTLSEKLGLLVFASGIISALTMIPEWGMILMAMLISGVGAVLFFYGDTMINGK